MVEGEPTQGNGPEQQNPRLNTAKNIAGKGFRGLKKGWGLAAGGAMLVGGLLGSLKNKASYAYNVANYNTRGFLSRTNWGMFILFSFLFYVVKLSNVINNGNSTLGFVFGLNLIFTIIVILVFYGEDMRNSAGYRAIGVILLLELSPFLISLIPYIQDNSFVQLYLLNPYIKLWWLYYAVFWARTDSNLADAIIKIIKWAILIFWIGVAFSSVAITFESFTGKGDGAGYEQVNALGTLWEKSTDFYGNILTSISKGFTGIKGAWKRQMQYATGDYYYGKVEDNQDTTLGVFIDNVKPSDMLFYENDPVTVWGRVKAKTLDDGVDINVSCYYGRKDGDRYTYNEQQKGTVMPESFSIYDIEEKDIDCKFPAGKILTESEKVTIVADFNFETMSYLKAYFMDLETMRSYARQGLDPLDQFGILDKKPVARYTNGPVQIGIGTASMPIGVGSGSDNNPRLGVTLEPNTYWKGKIRQINDLIVMVPEPMMLDTDFCPEFEKYESKENCKKEYIDFRSRPYIECLQSEAGIYLPEDEKELGNDRLPTDSRKKAAVEQCIAEQCSAEYDGYNAYRLKIDRSDLSLKNIGETERPYKTFSCRVFIGDAESILGQTPLSTKYFRAKARYQYELEESTTVKIKTITDGTKPSAPGLLPKTNNPKDLFPYIYSNYEQFIEEWSSKFGVDKCLIYGLIATESGKLGPAAVSSAGARGLMQVMPSTAMGVYNKKEFETYKAEYPYTNLFDPKTNILYGTWVINENLEIFGVDNRGLSSLKDLKNNNNDQYNRLRLAIGGYNWGPGNVKKSCCGQEQESGCTVYNNFDNCVKIPETIGHNANVLANMEYCQENHASMKNRATKQDTIEEDFIEKCNEIPIADNENNAVFTQIQNTKYLIKAWNIKDNQNIIYAAKLYVGTKESNKELFEFQVTTKESSENELSENEYSWHPKFPLIRFAVSSDGKNMKCLKIKDSVTTVTLKEPTNNNDMQGVWWNGDHEWIKARMEDKDTIKLFGRDNMAFCTLDFTGLNIETKCSDERLFAVSAVAKEVDTSSGFTSHTGIFDDIDHAKIQFEIDYSKTPDCCSDCSSCSIYECLACNRCKLYNPLLSSEYCGK